MGGPSAGVLLRRRLSAAQHVELEQMLRSLGERSDGSAELSIQTTIPIGEDYQSPGRPFSIHVNELVFEENGLAIEEIGHILEENGLTLEEMESQAIIQGFGFLPEQEIQLDAYCNGPQDHRILGLLALALAERFNGIIDFGGVLFPPLTKSQDAIVWDANAKWEDAEPFSRKLIDSMPGVAIAVPYTTVSRTWVYHIADTTFMRAWLAQPHFHMIK